MLMQFSQRDHVVAGGEKVRQPRASKHEQICESYFGLFDSLQSLPCRIIKWRLSREEKIIRKSDLILNKVGNEEEEEKWICPAKVARKGSESSRFLSMKVSETRRLAKGGHRGQMQLMASGEKWETKSSTSKNSWVFSAKRDTLEHAKLVRYAKAAMLVLMIRPLLIAKITLL